MTDVCDLPTTDADWRDPAVIRRLLTTPATWAVVGLSNNTARTAHGIARFLRDRLSMTIVPVHPRAETVGGARGFARLAEIPSPSEDGSLGPIEVVDCFVNSSRVGAVVDEAIAEAERLGIRAVWLQLGVVDEEAATRARKAGLDVVMDTCPAIEAPRLRVR
ncbi:MAG TPA: CoA-binding protein [Jiangellaceae bacterium]|nr:CoA-binding protein [Jiangellaceae bacterium]